jgi:hypothetical protein
MASPGCGRRRAAARQRVVSSALPSHDLNVDPLGVLHVEAENPLIEIGGTLHVAHEHGGVIDPGGPKPGSLTGLDGSRGARCDEH